MNENQNELLELTQQDIDIIGEVSNISMGSAATALSNIMGKKVVITSPHVEVGTEESINKIERVPSLGVIISYTEGVIGKDILIIRKADAIEIVKVLMGGELPEGEFGEIEISAIAEVMNQMMGSAATALSNFIGKSVNISPPSAFVMTEENRKEKLAFVYEQVNRVILVRFLFKIEDLIESDLYMIMGKEFADELVEVMMKNLGMTAENPAPEPPLQEPEPPSNQQPAPQYAPPVEPPQYQQPAPQYAPPVPQYAPPAPQYQQPAPQYYAPPADQAAAQAVNMTAMPQTQVRPIQFASFDTQPPMGPAARQNFELIEEVPLELSVEVGKAHKMVKEIIDFSVGSIIELNKQAGDPVDIIVNGQLIAFGEVVVIDESFGVRITEIVVPKNSGK
jgi:flagellar motor switch protein FliN